MIPPSALISSAARMSESRTVCSLMAMGPEVEFKNPSLTESPSTQVPPDAPSPLPPEPPDEPPLEPQPAATNASELTTATATNGRIRVFPNIDDLPSGSHADVRGPGTYEGSMS